MTVMYKVKTRRSVNEGGTRNLGKVILIAPSTYFCSRQVFDNQKYTRAIFTYIDIYIFTIKGKLVFYMKKYISLRNPLCCSSWKQLFILL